MDPYGLTAPLIDPAMFPAWIIQEDDDLLVVNKPGWFVCHPEKNGPFSSLLGAAQQHVRDVKLHLVMRLDRETSGLVLFAKNPEVAARYQVAMQKRRVSKRYLTILDGELSEPTIVDQSIGRRLCGPVIVKCEVQSRADSRTAVTEFIPRFCRNGFTLCEVVPKTGRTHQIRVHAEWLGHSVVGDKIYGPDETLFLEFIKGGWNDRLERMLPMKRQALHCERYVFQLGVEKFAFVATLPDDIKEFCVDRMGLSEFEINSLSEDLARRSNIDRTEISTDH